MFDAYDTATSETKTASLEAWRTRYLESVLRCLKTRKRDDIATAIQAATAYRRVRKSGTLAVTDDESKVGQTFKKRLYGMVLGNHGAWANFLVCDVGLEDADLARFKDISPFKGCILLLIRSGKQRTIRGEVGEFRAAFERSQSLSLTQVCRQDFQPSGDRRHHYVFQALRPGAVAARSSLEPPTARDSMTEFMRPSGAQELFRPSTESPSPNLTDGRGI